MGLCRGAGHLPADRGLAGCTRPAVSWHRGQVFVAPAADPHPVAPATVAGAQSIGIAAFDHPNGQMMESDGSAAIGDACTRNGKRASIFRTYTYP
jgi:hypothetical protein